MSTHFSENLHINFMQIQVVGAELFHVQTRQNSCFSQPFRKCD